MVVACTSGASIPAGSISPLHNRLLFDGTVAGVSRTVGNCIPCCDLPRMSERSIGLATTGRSGGETAILKGPLEDSIRF